MTTLETISHTDNRWQLSLHSSVSSRDRNCPLSAAAPCDLEAALRERIKELGCLYGISQLAEQCVDSLPDLLRGIVCLLPPSWQYPEICQARITLHNECYATEGFRRSPWTQSAAIRVRGRQAGTVEVVYLEQKPLLSEGPFLREERDLIDAIAERVGRMVDQFRVERQLEAERSSLREANAALKRVLSQIEDEKVGIYQSIQANVEKILLPTLRVLASEIPVEQRGYVTLLQNQLGGLASPFAHKMSKEFANLTPAEIEVCNMVRSGMSTKEIAQLRRVAPATVSKQRERIRRKLQISGTDANLTTHLLMLSPESSPSLPCGIDDAAIVY